MGSIGDTGLWSGVVAQSSPLAALGYAVVSDTDPSSLCISHLFLQYFLVYLGEGQAGTPALTQARQVVYRGATPCPSCILKLEKPNLHFLLRECQEDVSTPLFIRLLSSSPSPVTLL